YLLACSCYRRDVPSFPTRRSSDLGEPADNTDHDQHGDPVSDSLVGDPLAEPHTEHGSRDQDHNRAEIEKEPRSQDRFRIDGSADVAIRLKSGNNDGENACILVQLPPT